MSCCRFAANAVRLQLHTLARNLANFVGTLALPESVSHWSMTTLRDRGVKISPKIVRHDVERRRCRSRPGLATGDACPDAGRGVGIGARTESFSRATRISG